MELNQLEKLLELAAKYGVVKLKTPEVEIELGGTMQASLEPTVPVKQEISDEDMLFWSVNGQTPAFAPPEAPKE